jgi:hypothetical protein
MERGTHATLKVLIAISFSMAIVKADEVPIVWTGAPTITSATCNGCPFGGTAEPNPYAYSDSPNAGLDIQYESQSWALGASTSSSVVDEFTIASPAAVDLTLALNDSIAGNEYNFYGQVSGSVDISGAGGSLDVPFSSSGFSSNCQGACNAGLSLSDSESGIADLLAGTYTVTVEYSDSNSSFGDSFTDSFLTVGFSDPIASAPEPNYVGLVGLLPLAFLLGQRFSRRSRKVCD